MNTTTTVADLKNFAAAVIASIATVDASSSYRFGRKTFIAALDPSKTTKRLLIEAHREGLLILTRADLYDFDPAIVASSETTYMNATFHFVEGPRAAK